MRDSNLVYCRLQKDVSFGRPTNEKSDGMSEGPRPVARVPSTNFRLDAYQLQFSVNLVVPLYCLPWLSVFSCSI